MSALPGSFASIGVSLERDGQTSEEHAEIRRLQAENRGLREAVAILKAATLGHSSFLEHMPSPRTQALD